VGEDGQVTSRTTGRPSEAWDLVDFGEGPPGSLIVPVRWRGDEGAERPTLLPYRAGAREFTTATGDALTAEVESLRIAGAKSLRGVWTDAPNLEIDGHDGNIIISWRPGQPTTANIALLRKLHHPFSEMPLSELRNRMQRGPQFSFHAEFHYHWDERAFVKKLEEGGMDAVMTAATSWEMAWPPAHVVVERYADMWAKPYRFVLEEWGEDEEPAILHAETGHFVLIEEGVDLLRVLTKRMREEGVPVRKRTRREGA